MAEEVCGNAFVRVPVSEIVGPSLRKAARVLNFAQRVFWVHCADGSSGSKVWSMCSSPSCSLGTFLQSVMTVFFLLPVTAVLKQVPDC